MGFDGPHADPQLGGRLLVGLAARHADQHLTLPRGKIQRGPGDRSSRIATAAQCGREVAGDDRTEVGVAGLYGPDALADLGRRAVLAEIAVRARPDTLD